MKHDYTPFGKWLSDRFPLLVLYVLACWTLAILLAGYTCVPAMVKLAQGTWNEKLGMNLLVAGYARLVVETIHKTLWKKP